MDFQDCLSLQALRFGGPSEIYFKVHQALVFGIDVANEPRTLSHNNLEDIARP